MNPSPDLCNRAETRDFGAVTLLAVRMRATNNLSLQASRKISVLCTRKLPVWTGTGWSAPQPTRSIAWALADAARNPVYGAGLADAQIDLAGLLALDAQWAARGDSFDGRFDRPSTWWEAATRIAWRAAELAEVGAVLETIRLKAVYEVEAASSAEAVGAAMEKFRQAVAALEPAASR
jgi:hypothetical protein